MSPRPLRSPPTPADGAEVEASLLQAAYERLRPGPATTGAVSLLFVGPLWPFITKTSLALGWLAALLCSMAAQWLLVQAFNRATPAARALPRWHALLLTGQALSGAAWSFGPTLMMPQAVGAESALFVTMLLCICAVAAHQLAAQGSALQCFLLAALGPPAAVSWWSGGAVEQVLALVLLAGLMALLLVGRRSSESLRALFEVDARLRAAVAQAGAAREHAEAASLAKTRFLANMSHELRTPLNAVIGGAQLLRAEQAGPQQQAHLVDAIQRSGTHLLGLIENILDLSRIEAGEMPLHPGDFHLVECIEAALSTAALSAQAKGLALACVIDPTLPAWRHGDAARLRQVVLNLLGNAVKFTAQGEVVVRVQPTAQPDGVRISISDTGVGIGAASLARIFEPFCQADDGADRRFGGSGLGLAIVRQLVQAMGGQVGVRSTLGQGSCFEIELPLPAALHAPAEPAPLGKRVAYFEPHAASADALAAQLQRLGCQGQRCSSPEALRQWLLQIQPAAGQQASAPTPWLLLATDGAGAAAWLDGGLEQVLDLIEPDHVVALSNEVVYEADQARDGLQLPRQIVKPVTRAALVSRLLEGTGTGPGAAPPAAPRALLSATELQALTHVLVVEDDELNRSIVCGLLEHAGHRVSAASGGAQALQHFAGAERIDLVLMDWQMPGMDGLETTRRLRSGEAGPAGQHVPIVALTANAFGEDRATCLAAGMDDFLTKPVLAASLLAAVGRWTAHHAAAAPAALPTAKPTPAPTAAPAPAAAPPAAPPPVFDPTLLAALPMVADGSAPEYADELLQMFLQAGAGLQQRIAQAQATADLRTLQRELHTLKSSAASIGALALSALAARHEHPLRLGQAPSAELAPLLGLAFDRLHQATRGRLDADSLTLRPDLRAEETVP